MPELPEVETTLRGITPHIVGLKVTAITVRQHKLRWPIPVKQLHAQLIGQKIKRLYRRAKYLLLECDSGTLIIHLGMSGRLRILKDTPPAQKHDHVDIVFNNKIILRYTDPRRFGAVLWVTGNPEQHILLKNLGIEPLDKSFTGAYLQQKLKNKNIAIKTAIMNHHIVVGVGNIYAAEALFLAGIHPVTPAKSLTSLQLKKLVKAIKDILRQAIKQGGTTLKDFTQSDGKPGYFVNKLNVYGRSGLPCVKCDEKLIPLKIGQRSTVYCEHCQYRQS
jgi:formamidopyrimidine-DNA glycosylase